MLHQAFSQDEQMAASAVAALASCKRGREDEDNDVEMKDCKMAKMDSEPRPLKPVKNAPVIRVLRPAPFFFYKDLSQVPDSDPLTPLTAPGRVPNFPAKMHAILSRTDVKDVVTWLPHGRAWRVLKPREFEIKILPTYFDHNKFSSFIRQANGWGFRRITQGPDRNSYYHEKFLRGLPHLSKDMKRPGVKEKSSADPNHEPDFYEISKVLPVPEKIQGDESALLQCTLQGGPRARMPIYTSPVAWAKPEVVQLPPRDRVLIDSFQQTIAASESQFRGLGASGVASPANHPSANPADSSLPLPPFLGPPSQGGSLFGGNPYNPMGGSTLSALAMANLLSMQAAPAPLISSPSSVAAAISASQAASQFAAGFAAATAFSQHQFQSILGKLAQGQHNGNGGFAPSGFR